MLYVNTMFSFKHPTLLISSAAFCVGFRVKAPVAQRPPHRSGREDFPHPVPRCYPFLRIGTTQATPRMAHNFAAQALDIVNDSRLRQWIPASQILKHDHAITASPA
jgi:hypothetical protein